MREMVLNHASLVADNRYVATEWLIGLSKGISAIRSDGIVTSPMRAGKYFYEIQCTADAKVLDLIIEMLSTPSTEEAQLLMELDSKSLALPLNDANQDVTDEDTELRLMMPFDPPLSMADGTSLLYCAIADGIAVGFPSDPVWEQDQIDVYFEELSTDGGELGEVSETIDNLTRLDHAVAIVERHRTNMRDVSTFGELWDLRGEMFPNLLFGFDVEGQLGRINPSALSAVTKKLSMLDGDAGKWRTSDTAMPEWSCRVRSESTSVRNNPSLIEARRFRSCNGNREIFEWHADFGYDRIHFRFDAQTKEVEIGYIGEHLPL